MKLAICVLISVAALVCGDSSYQSYQSHPNYPNYYEEPGTAGSYQNYYQSGVGAPQRRQSFIESIRGLLFSGNRRQGLAGIGAFFPVIIIIVFAGVVIAIFVAFFASQLNSSGRGLDTDEWEVDHSVWMNQLQKDFEDSWSIE